MVITVNGYSNSNDSVAINDNGTANDDNDNLDDTVDIIINKGNGDDDYN